MKIVIMGNSGAGKSTMARSLAASRGVRVLSLDEVAWAHGVTRRTPTESKALLDAFLAEHPEWVIEGCYADLIEYILPHCEELRFLNPGVEVCVAHCLTRPWEPEKFESPEAQQAALNGLLDWVRSYQTRDDEYGLTSHRRVFERFEGPKREYTQATQYGRG